MTQTPDATKTLPLIGRGMFSTVYRKNAKTVLIKSVDPVKECMAMGWFPSSRMFPKTTRVALLDDDQGTALYEQRYYPKAMSLKAALKPVEWEFYRELRKVQDHMWGRYNVFGNDQFKILVSLQSLVSNLPSKYARKKSALLDAIDALTNYGPDIRFEISPRNVAVHNGRLILLDCFFMAEKAKEVRTQQRKRR